MTRQDYILLAEALRMAKPVTTRPHVLLQWEIDCSVIADALAEQSRSFDRELFLRNCGVQS